VKEKHCGFTFWHIYETLVEKKAQYKPNLGCKQSTWMEYCLHGWKNTVTQD